MRELELKAVVHDLDAALARLVHNGAVCRERGTLRDRRFDTADRALRARDVVLRLREFNGMPRGYATLDWKGAARYDSGYKEREEISLGVDDVDHAARILYELGFLVSFEIERGIDVYELHGAMLRFERYPRMDSLVEVEGEPQHIERAIDALGMPRTEFSTGRLADFARAFEERTGVRAAFSAAELDAAAAYARDDA
ncbi:MAG: class IV adenylate cyclase [Gemmatimonadaceae bacterium]